MNIKNLLISIVTLAIAIVLFTSLKNYLNKTSEKPQDEAYLNLDECSGVLTILFDNNPFDPMLETEWGFSCLVELGDTTILFDTGLDGELLTRNMERLDVDAKDIDFIVLSHIHADHTRGIYAILEANNNVTVFFPASFPYYFKTNMRIRGVDMVEVQNATRICECAATTGVLGTDIEEQSLMVNTPEGLVVITGCSHPGIVNITKKAKELTDKEVYLVIGGFHLAGLTEATITRIISEMKELGVIRIAPCHCSGDTARRLFRESFGADYVEAGVGKILQIP
jgi:7,8-dihydropterin-6-yl-methyl-4-(beta-D-ribofuranosyl)aminobenzene 5'-phosphate synthase